MALTRRIRYEILRRDNYTCQYCGAKAPDVALTVDHVVPVALGGTDDASNLVTACRPCNEGKAAVAPDSPIVATVDRRAKQLATAIMLVAEERRLDLEHERFVVETFDEIWTEYQSAGRPLAREPGWIGTVLRFVSLGLELEELAWYVRIAMDKPNVATAARWKYFCGCCWGEIKRRQADALETLDQIEQEERECLNETEM